ncbi:hypothetical protein [Rhizobium sullae]|uniref:hypothetical protein n=1 Tax=Rhizobium sullae TaxID=50338 RepID=UPI001045AF43|nr:hypothetical protein [Rhizobium sullae]
MNGSSSTVNQGVVARDANGGVWILHRGRINVDNERGILHDFADDAAALQVDPVKVIFEGGRREACLPVAPLEKPLETVRATKRFVDLCRLVRIRAVDGEEIADVQRKAFGFEEPSGNYTIPARDPIGAERQHHDVCEALNTELSARNFDHTNEKIGRMGPDLYTTGTSTPILFELKTGNSADDLLKAVGQLVVYEKLIGRKCRRIMVLPAGVRGANRELITSLDIEIVDYHRDAKAITFAWPKDFFPH